MTRVRQTLLAAAAAPLILALAACGSGEEATASGEPIASIEAPEGQSWLDVAAVTPEGGNVVGNPDAPLRLVEYASHTCPACAAFSEAASGEIDKYIESGVVSYEIRNQIHHPIDLAIAVLVRCGEPTAFHPLANQAWANLSSILDYAQQNSAAMNVAMQAPPAERFQRIAESAGLLDFFAARGISRDQAMQCLANTDQIQQIADNSNTQSQELNIPGTPTFLLNGRMLTESGWEDVEAALQAAGAR